MKSIKEIREITGKIIDCEDSILDIRYRIEMIKKDGSKVIAKLTLETHGRRSQTQEWLTNDEVLMVLNRRLKDEEDKLKKLNAEYNNPQE